MHEAVLRLYQFDCGRMDSSDRENQNDGCLTNVQIRSRKFRWPQCQIPCFGSLFGLRYLMADNEIPCVKRHIIPGQRHHFFISHAGHDAQHH